MKKLLLLLIVISLYGFSFAQEKKAETPYQSLIFNNANIKNVEAITEGGYISVIGAGTKNAQVMVYLKCAKGQMTKAEMEQDLKENYKFNVGVDGENLKAELIRKSDDVPSAKRLYASFYILVPPGVNTKLTTAGADITVDGLDGKQDFATSGGKLLVVHDSGDIKGATSGGDVIVNDCKQNINLSTSGGRIIASRCEGTINLAAAGGRIILTDMNGEIKVGTSGGDVIAKNLKGSLNASNAGGNIMLADLHCTVDAVTTKGDLYADVTGLQYAARLNVNGGKLRLMLPKQLNANLELNADNITGYDLQNFTGVKRSGKVSGQLNSGGAKIIANDMGGTMEIKSL